MWKFYAVGRLIQTQSICLQQVCFRGILNGFTVSVNSKEGRKKKRLKCPKWYCTRILKKVMEAAPDFRMVRAWGVASDRFTHVRRGKTGKSSKSSVFNPTPVSKWWRDERLTHTCKLSRQTCDLVRVVKLINFHARMRRIAVIPPTVSEADV